MRKAMNCRHKGAYRTSHLKGGAELSLRGCEDVSWCRRPKSERGAVHLGRKPAGDLDSARGGQRGLRGRRVENRSWRNVLAAREETGSLVIGGEVAWLCNIPGEIEAGGSSIPPQAAFLMKACRAKLKHECL